ncbi:MAG: hypothetical protein IPK13_11120 [Deltaproteobacteria bacterium]|nr:hypothetical protein [Deltaproteobacteria bacterium]
MAVPRQPAGLWLVKDLCRVTFFGLLIVAALVVALVPIRLGGPVERVLVRALMGSMALFVAVSLLRVLIPAPRPGSHRVGWNADYLRWVVSEAFVSVALHPVVRMPFWHLQVTRTAYLKALGASVPWRSSTHDDFVLREPCLVQIGLDAQLEAGVVVECSVHRAGRLVVAPVLIGNACLLGAHTVLMPGATIGHDVRLEPATLIGEDVHVGVGASIGEGVRLERGVDLGSYAIVGTGSILAEGVHVGDRARVGAGSYVEPNTIIGEREYWAGTPARRMEPSEDLSRFS